VESLLGSGADPNIRGGKYHTALQAAFQKPDSFSFNILLDNGADITVESRYGAILEEALCNTLQDLSEVYVEQTSTKKEKVMWRRVRISEQAGFFINNFELSAVESPKGRDDPAFLCSLEPVNVESEDKARLEY
jgi:hypothetical protein